MGVVLYGLLLAHFYSYREEYTHIGITFVVTVALKKLTKSIGSVDNADLIGLGGGCLTVSEFAKLLNVLSRKGFAGTSPESRKITGDALGGILSSIKESLVEHLTIHN